jgi:hypothetical protein
VLRVPHIRAVDDTVELSIADVDVNEHGQLISSERTLAPWSGRAGRAVRRSRLKDFLSGEHGREPVRES